jgi:hypothetical protein
MNDLYSQCNEQKLLSEREFVSTFCSKCRNRSCERAGWAKSTWEGRISTQVDRLLLNPNLQSQEASSRWEGIENLESLPHTGVIEVWGSPQPPTQTQPPLVLISEVSSEPPKPQTPRNYINTPAREITLAPTSKPSARQPTTTHTDSWSAPPNKVQIGGTFKMGK